MNIVFKDDKMRKILLLSACLAKNKPIYIYITHFVFENNIQEV